MSSYRRQVQIKKRKGHIMQIEAIFKDGVLIPLQPLKLKSKRVKIEIFISDYEVEKTGFQKTKLRERIDAILGEYAHPRPASNASHDKAVWHAHIEEKYGK